MSANDRLKETYAHFLGLESQNEKIKLVKGSE